MAKYKVKIDGCEVKKFKGHSFSPVRNDEGQIFMVLILDLECANENNGDPAYIWIRPDCMVWEGNRLLYNGKDWNISFKEPGWFRQWFIDKQCSEGYRVGNLRQWKKE